MMIAVVLMVLQMVFDPVLAAESKATDPKKETKAATNAAPKVIVIPKSTFSTKPVDGKDPFFPESIRRTLNSSGSGSRRTNAQPGQVIKVPLVPVLQGLSGTRARRLAIISGRTFAPDESGSVQLTNGVTIRLKCLEILARSVMVQIEGEPGQRELKLRGE